MCDLPFLVVEEMGKFINNEVRPDTVVYTGDTSPHDSFWYDLKFSMNYTNHFSAWMRDTFGNQTAYLVEGNHDFEVEDSQIFETQDPMIPVDFENWKHWMDEEA
jgi:hypothetical protein